MWSPPDSHVVYIYIYIYIYIYKVVGVTFVVASGLPCGREGPMVQLGAGVAYLVLHLHNKCLAFTCSRSAYTEGRLLDEDLDTRDFVSMGAAAGVAAAFDAPIGGVLFAIEEVRVRVGVSVMVEARAGARRADRRRAPCNRGRLSAYSAGHPS